MLRTSKNSRNAPGCYLNIVHDLKLALLIAGGLLMTDLAQAETTFLNQIETQVRSTALQQLASQYPETEIELSINPINPALALEPCSEPLDIRFPYANEQRLTARVNCTGVKPWSIFVTARLTLWRQIVVAADPITRGAQIRASQLMLGRVDTSRGLDEYFTRIDQVAGQRAKRTIAPQQPIMLRDLEPALLVNRGDRVTLEANRAGVQIRVAALALEDGRKGDQIRVQNLESKREVYAEVIDQGRVEIRQ